MDKYEKSASSYDLDAGNTNEQLISPSPCQIAGIIAYNASGGASILHMVNTYGDRSTGWGIEGQGIQAVTDNLRIPIASGATFTSSEWLSGLTFDEGLVIWAETNALKVNLIIYTYVGTEVPNPPPPKTALSGVSKHTYSGLKRPSKVSPSPK